MNYLLAAATDIGTRKETNQDSILIKRALYGERQIVLAVMCDGMGGLEKGEVASASLVKAFATWFDHQLPSILSSQSRESQLVSSWDDLIKGMNQKIGAYGKERRIRLGTTVTAMLFLEEDYYIAHVGDIRAYELHNQIMQLTKDQTLVQREVDEGLLDPEDAENDPRRSVLLQCVGSSDFVSPVYLKGTIGKNMVYLLCCDGFRHVVTPTELFKFLSKDQMSDEVQMEENIRQVIEVIKSRGEQDNISAIAIRTW